MITREEALDLVSAQNPEEHMILHALQTEAVMRALAARLGRDQDLWGMTGLVHDLDYPATKEAPERHGLESAAMLEGKLPAEAVRAITAHNGEMTGVGPETELDFGLRCGETVTGMIHAAALMRPTGYEGLAAKSVKKKMKDKAFARSVRRENIMECEKAGVPLDEFLTLAIGAMAGVKA
ncbi:MAG: HDIG domain-containing metalloprotein [Thermodesulfobacteriota bacterium]|jgi:putative nucleotidyltransferase with HDIG domain